jgi:integrase
MATIRSRTNADGTTAYHVQVRLKGHPTQTASFRRLTDARQWAQRTESDLRERRYFPGVAAKRHTVTEIVDRYQEIVLPRKRPNTVAVQRSQLRWWRERMGHMLLSDVTPAMIAEQRDVLAQTFKPGTVKCYLNTLSHVFTLAVREWQWADRNPVLDVSRPQDPQQRVRFLSDDERRRLLDACKESKNPYLYIVVVLALSTGARKMELMTLRWPDVDLQRGLITLHNTKNRQRRALPLTGHALTLMREHSRVRRLDTDLVFPRADGLAPPDIHPAWDTARKTAGTSNLLFHDLRHSAASYLAMNGASLAEIAEILGHKSFDMVRRYAHLSEQHTANVVARMNRAVFGE